MAVLRYVPAYFASGSFTLVGWLVAAWRRVRRGRVGCPASADAGFFIGCGALNASRAGRRRSGIWHDLVNENAFGCFGDYSKQEFLYNPENNRGEQLRAGTATFRRSTLPARSFFHVLGLSGAAAPTKFLFCAIAELS